MVTAAVSAGLAISAFSCRLAPPGTMEVSQRFGLPPLPSTELVMFSTLTDMKSREALRTLAATFRDHRPGTKVEHLRPDETVGPVLPTPCAIHARGSSDREQG
ncbi:MULTISPECIES: hypothetical protein [Novosphingobium]|uniref:hypothetical protein n=1 Tax=Novosphingobium sp. TaxID=1874826 RepID=UPI00181F819C|nr:hypothetical protein [Novosphingobium sp.]